MIKRLTETILAALGGILAAIIWILSVKSQEKEKKRDEQTIAKITEKYSAEKSPDLSVPVNDLLARIRRDK